MTRRSYDGGAVATTLNTGIDDNDTSIVVTANGATYPDGAAADFIIMVEDEKILIDSRTTNTFTVAASGRGYDGTTAVAHIAGVTVSHVAGAIDFREINEHINDITDDHHTQYLNLARHDTTTRHAAGTALATDPPAASAVGDVVSAGASTEFARADHKHAREAFGSVAGIGTVSDPGSGTTQAHANHVHGLAAGTIAALLDEVPGLHIVAYNVSGDPFSDDLDFGEAADLGNPGRAVSVYAQGIVDGFSLACFKVGISFDGGGSYQYGNQPANTSGHTSILSPFKMRTGTPTGNVKVLIALVAGSGDDGHLAVRMVPA